MRAGEIWIMRTHIFNDSQFEQGLFESDETIEDTKVEILDIVDDTVYFMWLFSTNTSQLDRTTFLELYERVY